MGVFKLRNVALGLFIVAVVGVVNFSVLVRLASAAQEPNQQAFQLRVKGQDYAAARKSFRTHLLRKAASQPFAMPDPPADAKVVVYTSANLRLKAWVAHSVGNAAKSPVVVFLHGGFAFGEDDFEMARPYLKAGFSVVTPILRGEDGQSGAYSMFYDEVDDVLALLDYLRGQSWVDREHIFLAGHSVGGTMAMLSGMSSAHFKAVVSFSGSPNQFDFILRGGLAKIAPFDVGDPNEFEMRSPLAFPGSFKEPARLYYGTEEPIFAPSTQRLAQLSKRAGKDVEAVSVPGDHFSAVPEEIADSIIFFRSHF